MQAVVFLFGAAAGLAVDVCVRRYFSEERARFSPWRAAATALAAGVCFLWAQARFGLGAQWFWLALFALFLLAIARVDLERLLILNRMLLPLAALGALLALFAPHWGAAAVRWDAALMGAAASGGLLWAIACLMPGGLGGGDVKFAAVLGLWFGWQNVFSVLYGAVLAGACIGVPLLLRGRAQRGVPIPFGPFMALSAWLHCIYGAQIRAWLLAALL